MEVLNDFKQGLKDGLPIGLGYLSVSITFGMLAVTSGIPLHIAVIISLTNLTSAGQFAGLEIMVLGGSYIEMAMTQLIINLRYLLMSLSLTQKIDPNTSKLERAMISFSITDEIFALESSQEQRIGKYYVLGLSILPIFMWTLGTFIGGGASSFFPESIRQALGIAIYGMFLAIIIPPSKTNKNIRNVVILAIIVSCIFELCSDLIYISSGFVIILCTLISAGVMAYICPIKEDNYE